MQVDEERGLNGYAQLTLINGEQIRLNLTGL